MNTPQVTVAIRELSEEQLDNVSGGRTGPPPDPEMLPVDWQRSGNSPPPPPETPFENVDWDKILREGARPGPQAPRRPPGELI